MSFYWNSLCTNCAVKAINSNLGVGTANVIKQFTRATKKLFYCYTLTVFTPVPELPPYRKQSQKLLRYYYKIEQVSRQQK
jgi:hypothetical protein